MQFDNETTATQLQKILADNGHNLSLRTFRGSAYCQIIREQNKARVCYYYKNRCCMWVHIYKLYIRIYIYYSSPPKKCSRTVVVMNTSEIAQPLLVVFPMYCLNNTYRIHQKLLNHYWWSLLCIVYTIHLVYTEYFRNCSSITGGLSYVFTLLKGF